MAERRRQARLVEKGRRGAVPEAGAPFVWFMGGEQVKMEQGAPFARFMDPMRQ